LGFFPILLAKNLASSYVNNCRPKFPTRSREGTSVCAHLHGGPIMMGAHGLGEKGGGVQMAPGQDVPSRGMHG
jgi:hypothetical protein